MNVSRILDGIIDGDDDYEDHDGDRGDGYDAGDDCVKNLDKVWFVDGKDDDDHLHHYYQQQGHSKYPVSPNIFLLVLLP